MRKNEMRYVFSGYDRIAAEAGAAAAFTTGTIVSVIMVYVAPNSAAHIASLVLVCESILLLAVLLFNIRFRECRSAEFSITCDSIMLRIGKRTRSVQKTDAFFVTTMDLDFPGNKGYRKRRYILIWNSAGLLPKTRHPYIMLKT